MRQRVYQSLQGFLLAVLLLAGGVAYGQTVTTITVGSDGAQHTKIQDAINAIPNPVTGPVVVEIQPGEYVEKIMLPTINGTSETNTITFRASGDGDVKITYKMSISDKKEGIFTNKACDYVIFERLTFYTEVSASLPTNLVALVGGADHNTFRNCHFSSKHNGVGINGISLLAVLKGDAVANNHLLVDECHFEGGKDGVYFSAIGASAQKGCRVINSTFVDIGRTAISGSNVDDLVVEKNRATFTKNGETTHADVMFFQITNMAKARIAGNVVRMSTSKANVGIDLGYGNKSTAAGRLVVENNSIHITNKDNSKGQTAGISITRGVKFATIRYNSVLIDGSATNTEVRCVYIAKSGSNDLNDLIFENNLFQNYCTNGVVYSLFYGAATLPIPAANMSFSNNAAYSEGKFATVGGDKTADEWMSPAVANETTMVKDKALFADANVDLKLLNGADFKKAKPIAEVTVDIEGAMRDAEHPTIGAYEYGAMTNPAPSMEAGYPGVAETTTTSVSLTFKEVGAGADVYAVVKLATDPAPEKSECVLVESLIGSTPKTHTFESLQPNTQYKIYYYLKNANGQSDLASISVTTKNPAISPVSLTTTVADEDIYSDAVVAQVAVDRDAEVHYMVRKASEAAPALTDFTYKNSVKSGEPAKISVHWLDGTTAYKLYTYAKAADGGDSELKINEFTTKELVKLKAVDFNKMTVGEAPTAGDGFRFEGFKVVASDFPDWKFPQQSAKLEGTEGTIHVATNQIEGAELKGFYLRTKKAAKIELLRDTEATLFEGVVSTGWTYISLQGQGVLLGVKLTAEADAELEIDYLQHAPMLPIRMIMSTPMAVNDGGSQTLSATVSGGVWPYTVAWSSDKPETLGADLTQEVTTTGRTTYSCKVTDATGTDATGFVTVRAGNTLVVGGFEDLGLEPNSQWKGDPTRDLYTHFATGSFSLPNWRTTKFGADFGYASLTDTVYKDNYWEQDQRNRIGKGAKGTATWGVLYHAPYAPATSTITLQAGPDGVEVPGIWLTNNSYVYTVVKNGQPSFGISPVKEGDFLKVTIAADNGKAVEYYLADYRAETPAEDRYVQDRWAWVDLSSLEVVKSLKFSIQGSAANAYGPLYPSYVCVDEIGDARPEKRTETVQVFDATLRTIDLSAFTDLPKDALKAAFEGETEWPNGPQVSLDGHILEIQGWDGTTEASKDFTIHLNRKGVNEWLTIPVKLSKSVPTYTFAGITTTGDGSAKVLKADQSELQTNATVLATDPLTVQAEPAQGWRLAATNGVTAQGAVLQGDGTWVATADNFKFTVTFEKELVPEYTILSIDCTGSGTLKLIDAEGNELALGDKVKQGALITIKGEPSSSNYELKPENLKVEGLEAAGEQWKVTGDVKVSATFTEKGAEPTEYTVLALTVEGEGTLVVKKADGTELKESDKVKKDDVLTIEATATGDYELKEGALVVTGATKNAEGKYVVTGDLSVKATFTKKGTDPTEPTEFTVLALTVEGEGTLVVKKADGTELKENDKVKKDDVLTIEATATGDYELKEGALVVTGATKNAEGKYVVTGDLSVKATFTKKGTDPTEPTEYTVLTLAVEGKGKLELKKADGTVLKENDKVKKDDVLTVVATPEQGYEVKSQDVRVEGLELVSQNKFKVTGDVKVRVTFRAKNPAPVEDSFIVRIYPNPVSDMLSVESNATIVSYALYSLTGNLQQQGAPSAQAFTADFSSLPAGVYMLQLREAAGNVRTLRVVKR